MIAGALFSRGKSGLHRAGCRVTPGGGDSKDSATERNFLHGIPLGINRLWRVFAGKGGKVR